MNPESSSVSPDALLAHFGWIKHLAANLVNDPEIADDLVQETYLAALKHPPQSRDKARAWLSTVARNAARQQARGGERRRRREESQEHREASVDPEELTARIEQQRLLTEAVMSLSEELRTVVVLRYFDGLSSAEIARRLSTPAATIRGRLARALERLRHQLDQRFGDRRAWMLALVPLLPKAFPSHAGIMAITSLSLIHI